MDADWDEWDVIPDVFPVGVPSPRSFIPPTVKAAQIAPPPSIHITPRSPAVLQVPTALDNRVLPLDRLHHQDMDSPVAVKQLQMCPFFRSSHLVYIGQLHIN